MHFSCLGHHLGFSTYGSFNFGGSVDTSPIGMPNPENIGIAVGITLLSGLGAEINGGGP